MFFCKLESGVPFSLVVNWVFDASQDCRQRFIVGQIALCWQIESPVIEGARCSFRILQGSINVSTPDYAPWSLVLGHQGTEASIIANLTMIPVRTGLFVGLVVQHVQDCLDGQVMQTPEK